MTNLNYTFTNKTKNITFGLMAVGLLTIIAGFFTDHAPEGVSHEEYHHTRIWANLLVNGCFLWESDYWQLFLWPYNMLRK